MGFIAKLVLSHSEERDVAVRVLLGVTNTCSTPSPLLNLALSLLRSMCSAPGLKMPFVGVGNFPPPLHPGTEEALPIADISPDQTALGTLPYPQCDGPTAAVST